MVEDEPKLAELLADYLKAERYTVDVLADGLGVVDYVRENPPDLILLDRMLPGKDGLDVCRELRAFSRVPVIMVTARVEEIDRLLGLELGADDYVCKPFSPREVVARVKAVLRRSAPTVGTAMPHNVGAVAHSDPSPAAAQPARSDAAEGLVVNEETYQARCNGHVLDLTPAEFRLLLRLTASPGKVFTRDTLLALLYNDHRVVTDRTIDTHIKNLRRKLQQADPACGHITSIYGVGYRFDLP